MKVFSFKTNAHWAQTSFDCPLPIKDFCSNKCIANFAKLSEKKSFHALYKELMKMVLIFIQRWAVQYVGTSIGNTYRLIRLHCYLYVTSLVNERVYLLGCFL